MEANEYEYEEVDIVDIVRKLLDSWKLILKWCLVAGVIGLVIAFSIPKEYNSKAILAPESLPKTSSSLSAIASMAGVNLNNGSTAGDAISPTFYPDVVASNPFVVELFQTPVEYSTKDVKQNSDLYSYIKDNTRSPWWDKVIKAPKKAAKWCIGLLKKKDDDKKTGYAEVDPTALTKEQSSVAGAIRKNVSVTTDAKTGIVTIVATAQDPDVAKSLAQAVMDKIVEYVSDYRTDKARKDLEYYEKLFGEYQADYYAAQQRYARYSDANQGLSMQRVQIEQDRLRNEMELKYQLYNSCSQQLQSAKAKVQQETPVCAVINPPARPLKPAKPSKAKILVIFLFLGAVLACCWVLWGVDFIEQLKGDGEKAEEKQ